MWEACVQFGNMQLVAMSVSSTELMKFHAESVFTVLLPNHTMGDIVPDSNQYVSDLSLLKRAVQCCGGHVIHALM
jgi:hypothetical protein